MIAATFLLLAKAATAKKSSSNYEFFIIILIAYGAIYYFYFRPRRAKQQAARKLTRKVEVGDRAQTIGGLVAQVVNQTDHLITLRTDSGAELDFIPSAIARKYIEPDPVVADDEPDTHDTQEGDK
jgi:preprotein translocase YajC subunit